MSESITPEVGMGATLVYPSDRYPVVITRVSESGKTFWFQPLQTVSFATGHEPDRYHGPYPVWDHTYTDEEIKSLVRLESGGRMARLNKHGRYRSHGTPVTVGIARYRRDYSD